MKDGIVKNTIILIATSMIIRVLSLVNRIVLTRLLGEEGIALYVITLPSLGLFMTFAGFSLNIAVSKVIAENAVTGRHSEKKILSVAVAIGLAASAATILLALAILKPLIVYGLKQENAFFPLLASVFFLPLIALNNVFRGYFNGKNRMATSAYATLVEQVSRIACAFLLLYLFLSRGLIIAVTLAVLAMGGGEIVSLAFILWKMRKERPRPNASTAPPTNALLKVAIPTTASRLVGTFTYFLEPIVYTAALTLVGLGPGEILRRYSAITAYGIPLITLCSFVSTSIATVVIPSISKSRALGNDRMVNYYIKKSCLLSLVPGILISVLITAYGRDYMLLIYRTETGSVYAEKLGALFILFYLHAPLAAVMQAVGRSRVLFRVSLITSVIKLGLIFGLAFIPRVAHDYLIAALLVNTYLSTAWIYFYLKNNFKFRFSFAEILNVLILTALTISTHIILKAGFSNYLLNTVLLALMFFIYCKALKITRFDYK